MKLRLFIVFSFLLTFHCVAFAAPTEAQDKKEVESSELPAPAENLPGESESVAEEEEKARSFHPVTYKEKQAFRIFYLNDSDSEKVLKRAREASEKLERAINSEKLLEKDSPLVDLVAQDKGLLEVKVRGYKVIDLTREDQQAAGYEKTESYREVLKGELQGFVTDELNRLRIQESALKFFLSIFFALIGFVVFKQIHQAFNRAEDALEERRESFAPVVFFSETLLSGQALGGILALALVIGRMFAYVIVVLSTFAAIMGQFSVSREILGQFFSESLSQMVKVLQSLLEAIPGLLLGLILIFVLQISLKVLDLFLKSARSGRISIGFLNSGRVPVVRFWGVAILFVIFTPLILASIFGRFHTPLEIVFLMVVVALALATLPVLISVAVGSFVLWQGNIKPGQWIEVGDKSGEVTDVSLHKITIVPEVGGRVYIPMTLMLLNSCFEKKEAPKSEFQVRVVRKDTLKITQQKVEDLFPKSLEVSVTCLSVSAKEFLFALYAPQFQSDLRKELLSHLSEAHETGVIELGAELTKEIRH